MAVHPAPSATEVTEPTSFAGQPPRCVALIVAAGRGTRLGGALPKQYRDLHGQSVLRRTASVFLAHPRIDAVRVVIHPDDRDQYSDAVADLDLLPPIDGGATRQDSVVCGLESFTDQRPDYILIHDAARPLVSTDILDRVIAALALTLGAIPAVPVVDTLKRGSSGASPRIVGTVDRADLWRAQTPQGFHYQAILAAHRRCQGEALTDDAAVAERSGLAVSLVAGDEDNIKITSEDDFMRAIELIERRQPGGRDEAGEIRTALGFDVHRLGNGDHVMLCGVNVPHTAGLVGHSDADVGLHALTDALLGTIAAGDIGQHFPPSDTRWKGADSAKFLAHAGELIGRAGGRVLNVDVTVICERPKIGPHREAMRQRIAEILDIDSHRVSIKATTTERLGFTGRQEGIAAQAVATVWLKAAEPD